ncbi:MAG: bifunctional malic enzyme oxidoreductase/phosphotransacetylase [Candidatus Methanofastidiosum methylothiophilum]|uniref:Bifunctional malic enzyme oxidoreductase/phosphotransacetylase n=1 Tax=Candidatus Methanofastidiosum methylothiophilum TaxID=1705564 RepID=A0A150IU44_9EURY|nr:MAG: bifunctional malic enzyme oxidoreductase/phosphotransacetylase [Candidatus Methanofastidiosum methylthiophilus]KYC48493.1 MAG: bifunctional malic enzyme oxidoreductase/phosphotransacetylase [Candidatus Methanofastidiosum methylthiophilus]KYC49680.1 MAG: bifunctional malic enzyme oxidoreductase/phosphotransacetylase [Candidatus Methanofastidiosum methylthiophilus]
MEKFSKEDLIKKASKPAEDAMKLHPFYKGKIEVVSKVCIRDFTDFAIWYTPGVAEPCKAIHKNKEAVFEHTNKGNAVAVVSDGTRVLGLGNIGPEAAMPVMEGKALLFKYLGGVDAYPICLDTRDPDKLIETCKLIKPTFGGINLEDIEKPKCFFILDKLRADKEMDIPVWHDDQQGTATVEVAGAINALKVVGKKLNEANIVLVGTGAANIATSRVLIAAGANKKNIVAVDSKGILNANRKDLEEDKNNNPFKWDLCVNANKEQRTGGIKEALKGADICIAASKPGPDTIKKEEVSGMASDAILFASANPMPEIWPWEAKEAGVRIVGTGRSDFPNQINNSIVFPGIFRGALDVRAKTITDEMCVAAAFEIAKTAEDKGLSEEYIVPKMSEWEVFPREAVAVGMKAIEQGIARVKYNKNELYEIAENIIKKARDETHMLMKQGIIEMPPK